MPVISLIAPSCDLTHSPPLRNLAHRPSLPLSVQPHLQISLMPQSAPLPCVTSLTHCPLTLQISLMPQSAEPKTLGDYFPRLKLGGKKR